MPEVWSGRAVEAARGIVIQWLPMPCGQCQKTVGPLDRWVVGHKIARSLRPDLTFEVSNWQPEHRSCSDKSSQAAVIAKAKAEALAEHGLFPADLVSVKPPTLPVSLPEGTTTTRPDGPLTNAVLANVREDLRWSAETLRGYPWLVEFADVPEDASPPYAMTLPAPDAICSYGSSLCTHLPEGIPDCVSWVEATQKRTPKLRWWQRLAIVRQLEHRADGSLTTETIVESGPRRIGKSVRIRSIALWRMEFGEAVFGEVQTIIHTGSDVNICREIQRGAWPFAQGRWGKGSVTMGNGKECIETSSRRIGPALGDLADDAVNGATWASGGDRWMVRAQDAVYGYDVTLGLGDECWDVKPDTITEGLEPATLERLSPQIHLTSTAHRRATSLMRTYISDALTIEDPTTLLLLWAARPGSDPADPATWRAASPHWSPARERLIAKKFEKALAGEVDPEFDDPDPMAGFTAQYLNVWQLRATKAARGDAVIEADAWAELRVDALETVPRAAALEGFPGSGISVALVWVQGSRSIVSVQDHADLASAIAAVRKARFAGVVEVGASLATDPAVKRVRHRARIGRAALAVGALARYIAEDAMRHTDPPTAEDETPPHLTGQILEARTLGGADGLRMASTGRADAVKAAAWAIETSRSKPRSGRRPPRVRTAASA